MRVGRLEDCAAELVARFTAFRPEPFGILLSEVKRLDTVDLV